MEVENTKLNEETGILKFSKRRKTRRGNRKHSRKKRGKAQTKVGQAAEVLVKKQQDPLSQGAMEENVQTQQPVGHGF
jgi:hypothetical protein